MSDASARVLEALRGADAACSGEALSGTLGVSRAQVWKHIERLRRRGYEIDGEPGGGYRLRSAPDRLYPEELAVRLDTRWLAQEVEHLDETDSTNRVAGERARAGAAHGYTVIAEAQTAGRGRLGRSFFSPARLNLYSSSVLRPTLDTAAAPTLIPTAAIAVADAVGEELGSLTDVEIKWPNDVLIAGRKTCGILMEMQSEAASVGYIVLGIGVNLNVDPADFPEEFRAHATSVGAQAGRPIDRVAFAARLYSSLERRLDEHAAGGFARLRPRYEAHFRMPGREVRIVELDGSETTGTAAGIDDDGALLVDRANGERTRVIAGDVTLAGRAR
jgi:BirA family biotin operon repressor/biotin-[acetyl-CoA-carboxylase] ligase